MIHYGSADADRDAKGRTVVSSGDFAYELIADFPKYPNPDWEFVDVSSGCCDQNDVIYVLMRGLGNDILKLDSEGNYLGAIHQNCITTPHFCCITPDDNLLVISFVQRWRSPRRGSLSGSSAPGACPATPELTCCAGGESAATAG